MDFNETEELNIDRLNVVCKCGKSLSCSIGKKPVGVWVFKCVDCKQPIGLESIGKGYRAFTPKNN